MTGHDDNECNPLIFFNLDWAEMKTDESVRIHGRLAGNFDLQSRSQHAMVVVRSVRPSGEPPCTSPVSPYLDR